MTAALPVLVTDLDHSLIATDLLHESLWSATARDCTAPLRAGLALRGGRNRLKAYLAEASDIDVTTLPYIASTLAEIKDWRAKGGKTVLATGSDQRLAEAVAAHLGLFDEVHGSTPERNLTGETKAQLLTERLGAQGFDYIGDSRTDLPVWRAARRAITVGASASLIAEAERVSGSPARHLAGQPGAGKGALIKALRPHQWLKNLLIFLPLLAAHDFSAQTLWLAFGAFCAFSLVASSVYLLNDLLDLRADRAHPRKRERPFASGRLRIETGTALAPLLLCLGGVVGWAIGPQFTLAFGVYYVLTLAYSLGLKRRHIIDICTLAVLYTLRVVAGGAATGIPVSVWLLAFSLFFFFSLATIKRQAELVDGVRSGRAEISGRGYRVEDLPIVSMLAIAAGFVSVLVMALYVTSDQVAIYYSAPSMLWGICLVLLYWISRTVMITHRGEMSDDPVIFAMKDRNSQICGALIFALALAGALL